MNILVVGGGGREHALAWKISQSPLCDRLYCAPGNAGIADVAECVALKDSDIGGLVAFAQKAEIDLVVVGPEAPLVAGLTDAITAKGITCFGPSARAARLEGSKGFMKDLLAKYNVPTAAYGRFTDVARAKAFVTETGAPIVVKTDGLAAGKGVTVCRSVAEAHQAIEEAMIGGKFGSAGAELVIEEFLDGQEVSFFVICDGEDCLALSAAQDHKAVGEGDTGPNTGGMGAYSPAPVFTAEIEKTVLKTVIAPTLKGMAADGMPYRGVLFAGLMIGADGAPKLLEYNIRFGDPECQVLMRRMTSDIVPILRAAAEGRLGEVGADWEAGSAMVVVMAANGYPGVYEKGSEIRGLPAANAIEGVTVFHAGTKAQGGKVLAAGGRVLGVSAQAADITEAQKRAYQAVDALDWPQGFCRRDIGWRAIAHR